MALHLKNILETEGVDFKLDDLAMVVNAGYPDIRRVINSAQRQIVNNKLKIDISSVIQNDYKIQLLGMLSNGSKPKEIRKFLADNSVNDYAELYKLLYDNLDEYSNGKDAECILAIAEGQYQEVNVVDKEITFMATIVKLLRII